MLCPNWELTCLVSRETSNPPLRLASGSAGVRGVPGNLQALAQSAGVQRAASPLPGFGVCPETSKLLLSQRECRGQPALCRGSGCLLLSQREYRGRPALCRGSGCARKPPSSCSVSGSTEGSQPSAGVRGVPGDLEALAQSAGVQRAASPLPGFGVSPKKLFSSFHSPLAAANEKKRLGHSPKPQVKGSRP